LQVADFLQDPLTKVQAAARLANIMLAAHRWPQESAMAARLLAASPAMHGDIVGKFAAPMHTHPVSVDMPDDLLESFMANAVVWQSGLRHFTVDSTMVWRLGFGVERLITQQPDLGSLTINDCLYTRIDANSVMGSLTSLRGLRCLSYNGHTSCVSRPMRLAPYDPRGGLAECLPGECMPGIAALAAVLPQLSRTLRRVEISATALTVVDARRLGDALAGLYRLSELRLAHCFEDSESQASFVHIMDAVSWLTQLKVLDIQWVAMGGDAGAGFPPLLPTMLGDEAPMVPVKLPVYKPESEFVEAGHLLRCLRGLIGLTTLLLPCMVHYQGAREAAALAAALANLSQLRSVSLPFLSRFRHGMSEQTVQVVRASWTAALTRLRHLEHLESEMGAIPWSAAFVDGLPLSSMKVLVAGVCQQSRLREICQGLSSAVSLTKLRLPCVELPPPQGPMHIQRVPQVSVMPVVECLAVLTQLRDLSWEDNASANCFTDSVKQHHDQVVEALVGLVQLTALRTRCISCRALAAALPALTTLHVLHFDVGAVEEACLWQQAQFLGVLKACTQLTALSLTVNHAMTPGSFKQLASCLGQLRSLCELQLACVYGVDAFLPALDKLHCLPHLRSLDVRVSRWLHQPERWHGESILHTLCGLTRLTSLDVSRCGDARLIGGDPGIYGEQSWQVLAAAVVPCTRLQRLRLPEIFEEEDVLVPFACSLTAGHGLGSFAESPVMVMGWGNAERLINKLHTYGPRFAKVLGNFIFVGYARAVYEDLHCWAPW
jgi:hypothetical protein